MAKVSFTLTSRAVPSGVTVFPFLDVTAQFAGHAYYFLGIDTSTYTSSDTITVMPRFRINSATISDGCAAGPAQGGPHLNKDGSAGGLVGCSSNIPPFTTKLEVAAVVTVSAAGTLSGRFDLIDP